MKHEADLSAEQQETQEYARVSRKDENRRWTGRYSEKETTRTQGAGSLAAVAHRFPPSSRVKKRREFALIRRHGRSWNGSYINVVYLHRRRATATRLGITISKKYGRANKRNRFKRIVREAFRLTAAAFPPFLDINVFPKEGFQDATSSLLSKELKQFLLFHGNTQPRSTTSCTSS